MAGHGGKLNREASTASTMIERIAEALPRDYAEVVTNMSGSREEHIQTGLVISCYRRPEYLERFLKSLGESCLENVVLCFVDESDATACFPEFQGYRLFRHVDSPGFDLTDPLSGKTLTPAEMKTLCDRNPECFGFNTFGYLKSRIRPANDLRQMGHMACGLYVKERAAGRLKYVTGPIPDREAGLRATGLIRSFNLDLVPIIKLFKHRHGNMYESLRTGWDMLGRVFNCDFPCCLDPDTMVKKNWLKRLH
jgi:cellulose synthase/poly-beta-1,6-N-acetylglucosamine synthase-like glycosyltransferase